MNRAIHKQRGTARRVRFNEVERKAWNRANFARAHGSYILTAGFIARYHMDRIDGNPSGLYYVED